MLCAAFPSSPVISLTATASKADIVAIKESLNLRNPVEITANPDRPNIYNEKIFRKGKDFEFFVELLHNMATELKKSKLDYPLTIMYLQLKWCGFVLKYRASMWVMNTTDNCNEESNSMGRLFTTFKIDNCISNCCIGYGH